MVQFIVKIGNSYRLKCVNTIDNIDLFTYILVPFADNLCQQFGPRLGPVFDIHGIPEIVFLKSWFWKKISRPKKSCKNSHYASRSVLTFQNKVYKYSANP